MYQKCTRNVPEMYQKCTRMYQNVPEMYHEGLRKTSCPGKQIATNFENDRKLTIPSISRNHSMSVNPNCQPTCRICTNNQIRVTATNTKAQPPMTILFPYVCVYAFVSTVPKAPPLRVRCGILMFLFLLCLNHPSGQVLCWPTQLCLHLKVPELDHEKACMTIPK